MKKVRESKQPAKGKKNVVIDDMICGQYVRQGDVYIMKIDLDEALEAIAEFDKVRAEKEIHLDGFDQDHVAKTLSNKLLKRGRLPFSVQETRKIGKAKLPTGATLLKAPGRWKVTHREHAHLFLPAGYFVVWGQVEINPESGNRRQVLD